MSFQPWAKYIFMVANSLSTFQILNLGRIELSTQAEASFIHAKFKCSLLDSKSWWK